MVTVFNLTEFSKRRLKIVRYLRVAVGLIAHETVLSDGSRASMVHVIADGVCSAAERPDDERFDAERRHDRSSFVSDHHAAAHFGTEGGIALGFIFSGRIVRVQLQVLEQIHR